MSRILIVSNRLPVTASKSEGKINFIPSVGGLATGISSFHQNHDCLWIGWSGIARDEMSKDNVQDIITQLKKIKKTIRYFYPNHKLKHIMTVFAIKQSGLYFTLLPNIPFNDNILWDEYKKVNKIFCQNYFGCRETG